MIELPGFSEALKSQFKEHLDTARKYLKTAVDIGRSECIVYEFDFTITDALRSLSEVSFLLYESRQRTLAYKYARYKELDLARKIANRVQAKRDGNPSDQISADDNLALQEEVKLAKDEWEE